MIFIKSWMIVVVFLESVFIFASEIVAFVDCVMILWDCVDWLYWKFSLIYWHKIANLLKIFDIFWVTSWAWISSEITHHSAAILADSFQFNSFTRLRNSEKKLVNSQFLCQRILSLIIAVYSWLASSYVCSRKTINETIILNESLQ